MEQLFAIPALASRQMVDDLLKYKRLDGIAEALTALAAGLFEGGRQRAQPARRLGETRTRVLVVWGAADRIIPAKHAANAPASATVRVIEGAGHMVQMEKAGEVNTLLGQHLAGSGR